MKLRPVVLLAAVVPLLALGACGKRGTLERPPPLWGHQDAQPQPTGRGRMDVPETRNVPAASQPVETGKSDPIGPTPTEPRDR